MKIRKYLPKKAIDFWEKTLLPYFKDPLLLNKWDSPQSRDKVAGRITAVVNTGYRRLISHEDYKLDLYMFWHDMTDFIMPINHRAHAFSVVLSRKNSVKEKIIKESFDHQRTYDLKEAISEFIEEVGRSLFSHSESYHEIKITKDKNGKIIKIEFLEIYPPSMIHVIGRYFQFVPWKAAQSAGTKAGIRRVPNDSVLHITLPSELGGKRGTQRILKRLATLSKILFPDFHLKSFEQNKQTGFDLNSYIESKYIEKAQLTKKFGWNQRKYQESSVLEYYSIHRHLDFVYSQTLIREHILKQLNSVIKEHLGTEILLPGLITTTDIKREMSLLKKGNIEFNSLFKRTSRY